MSITELVCTGEDMGCKSSFKTRYIQGYQLNICHAGLNLDIILRDPSNSSQVSDACIDLQYESLDHKKIAVLEPRSVNKIYLYQV